MEGGRTRATRVQAGKLLCVSETIFPDGSRHSMIMVYEKTNESGGLKPSPQRKKEGGGVAGFQVPGHGALEIDQPGGMLWSRFHGIAM